MKKGRAKDWTGQERAVIMTARLFTGGSLRPHDLASEFGVSIRQIYRDLERIDRHIPLDRTPCDDKSKFYRRADL